MKKFLFCAFFLLTFVVAAEPLKQYQTFKWKPVANAKKYEVAVEEKDTSGNYIPSKKQETKDIHVEMLLFPGDYRVSISAFNVLGKKASSSPWVKFVILDETEPYLAGNTFENDSTYNALVIRRTKTIPNLEENTTAEEKIQENGSLTISGRNIFFPETKFKLIPIENPDFEAISINRKEVDLPVLDRDREQNQLDVSVDWTKLDAGFYRFEVENPGGQKDSSDVLVLPEKMPTINEKAFAFNRRYNVHSCTVIRSEEPTTFVLKGNNFQANTKFTLEPTVGIPYPFASEKKRENVELKITPTPPLPYIR